MSLWQWLASRPSLHVMVCMLLHGSRRHRLRQPSKYDGTQRICTDRPEKDADEQSHRLEQSKAMIGTELRSFFSLILPLYDTLEKHDVNYSFRAPGRSLRFSLHIACDSPNRLGAAAAEWGNQSPTCWHQVFLNLLRMSTGSTTFCAHADTNRGSAMAMGEEGAAEDTKATASRLLRVSNGTEGWW